MTLGVLLVAASLAASSTASSTASHVVHVDGAARRYRLHVPDGAFDATGDAALPLVVAFHAAGASAARQERVSGLSALADRAGFVVVYPEALGGRWAADAADERFVRAVVADVARRVRVDPRRVYATGVSNGATMVARLACAADAPFAAVATVAGVYPAGGACAARPLPVLAIHGRGDRLAPFAAGAAWAAAWGARNGCAAEAVARADRVTTRRWTACASGADVVLRLVDALGHGWPGDATDAAVDGAPIDATAEVWAFFAGRSAGAR